LTQQFNLLSDTLRYDLYYSLTLQNWGTICYKKIYFKTYICYSKKLIQLMMYSKKILIMSN